MFAKSVPLRSVLMFYRFGLGFAEIVVHRRENIIKQYTVVLRDTKSDLNLG